MQLYWPSKIVVHFQANLSESYYGAFGVTSAGNTNFYTGVFNIYHTFFQPENDMLIILREGYVRPSELYYK